MKIADVVRLTINVVFAVLFAFGAVFCGMLAWVFATHSYWCQAIASAVFAVGSQAAGMYGPGREIAEDIVRLVHGDEQP